MEIDVKGHSGCDIEIVRDPDDGELCVNKSTQDTGYFKRLINQALKQEAAAKATLQYIRVPRVRKISESPERVDILMDYVYSRNFVEFFEQAGFEQVDYLIGALKMYIEHEISLCQLSLVKAMVVQEKFADVVRRTLSNKFLTGDKEVEEILARSARVFDTLEDMEIPLGVCHGDLTFSNILFNGNNYYLIDFLDSFIESPLLDLVKLRQDTAWMWSPLMYTRSLDHIRMRIAFSKIDAELDSFFRGKYSWYDKFYAPLQLMNFLRILQYAHETRVIEYLKRVINEQLEALSV